ncbi:cyclophilin-like domain-containing protein [Fomitopsis betulina]|nr:cyclophilin-like domain-containing protein [Fomitopsis betulina]
MVNPRVFLDFAVDGSPAGRVIFELFADDVPKTAENFRALCTGEKSLSERPLYYKNSIIHRSIPGFMIQGGDFTKRNGTGGESIYGGTFPDEDLRRPLDSEGLLCMANKGPNTNGSQFFVTLRECPHLNGKHVVFGRVIRGYDVVQKIAEAPTDVKDRPTIPVTIVNCGELVLKSKAQAHPGPRSVTPVSGSDDERSENERTHKKRRHYGSDEPDDDRGSAADDPDPGIQRKKSKLKHRSKGKDKIRSKHKHKKDKERSPSRPLMPSVPVPPGEETDEQYDARLEREEKERLEDLKRRELERLRRLVEDKEARESDNGVRFKGRGRMKYVDPELRGHRDS